MRLEVEAICSNELLIKYDIKTKFLKSLTLRITRSECQHNLIVSLRIFGNAYLFMRERVVVVPRVRRVYTGREGHVGRYLTAIDERGSGGGGRKNR